MKAIAHDNERLQAFIPGAIEKFHQALDELENEIVGCSDKVYDMQSY